MENVGALITAILGTAGASGLVTGLVQYGRVARSTRLIEHLSKLIADGDEESHGREALQVARDWERLRLASFSLVSFSQVLWRAILLIAGLAAVAVAVNYIYGTLKLPLWALITLGVAYVLIVVFAGDWITVSRRNKLLKAVWEAEVDKVPLLAGRKTIPDLKGRFLDPTQDTDGTTSDPASS
jgi:hypothetical protein